MGEGGNTNTVANGSAGSGGFHGFNSHEINIVSYLSPMFNKTGVATDERTTNIIEGVCVEWRTVIGWYNRMMRGVLTRYNTLVADCQGERR